MENIAVKLDLDTIISNAKLGANLVLLPTLRKTLSNPNSSLEDFASIIRADAALSAKILKFSNSAYFNCQLPASTLEEALQRLGMLATYKIASFSVAESEINREMEAYQLTNEDIFWSSINCACIMETIAKNLSLDHNSAYLAGLLHNLGKGILNDYFIKKGISIYCSDEDVSEEKVIKLEKQFTQFHNGEITAKVLEKWYFPEFITTSIYYQYRPLTSPDPQGASLVHMGKVISKYYRAGQFDPETIFNSHKTLLQALSVDIQGLLALEMVLQEKETEMKQLMTLN